jgi:hypothetical protein
MRKILPMISSITSIDSPKIDLFKMVYKNYNNNDTNENKKKKCHKEPKLVLKQMMAKTRILSTSIDW